ncbi:hypothetical protein HPE56_09855 [Maribacter sp. ANRC-HE7]|uniref:Glycosyltransferase RgtA/B/C/D-like domain-containing protein n=1 Tax=Maribacter aquimaris TaxID=2737171 RepID=A0ABR7V332_9FLAO|nr:hypothetical protein [Maribacter aquimaris]MBD0778096.1 hypothetical protein [Maribacter aquimaris]
MVILILLAVLVSAGVIVLTGSTSIATSLLYFVTLGTGISFWLTKGNRRDRLNLLKIFFSSYVAYVLFSLVSYLDYNAINDFFLFPDQTLFFEVGETLGKGTGLSQIFQDCFILRIHEENEGAYFIFGLIGFVANKYFDGNSILLQSLHVGFMAMILNLFLYKTIRFHTYRSEALKFALLFAFFSPLFFYAPWILRDVHIALLYAIGIYMMHTRFTIKRLLLFIPLIIVTLEFRLEMGLFSFFMPVYYFYFRGKKHRNYKFLLTSFIFVGVAVFGMILNFLVTSIEATLKSFESYSSYTEENLGGGLGAMLYELPVGLKQLAVTFFSQIMPFPAWGKFLVSETSFEYIISLIECCGAIFWSCLFLFMTFAFTNKKVRKHLSKENIVMLVIALVFLLGNSSEMNTRRILCIYPLIFILYLNIRHMLPKRKRMYYSYSSIALYSALSVIYFFIKYSS